MVIANITSDKHFSINMWLMKCGGIGQPVTLAALNSAYKAGSAIGETSLIDSFPSSLTLITVRDHYPKLAFDELEKSDIERRWFHCVDQIWPSPISIDSVEGSL